MGDHAELAGRVPEANTGSSPGGGASSLCEGGGWGVRGCGVEGVGGSRQVLTQDSPLSITPKGSLALQRLLLT